MASGHRTGARAVLYALGIVLSACSEGVAKPPAMPGACAIVPSSARPPIALPVTDIDRAAEMANLTKAEAYLQRFEKAGWYGEVKGWTFEGDVLVINTPLPPDTDRSDDLALEICNALSGFRVGGDDTAAGSIGDLEVHGRNDELLAQRRPSGDGS